MAIEHQIRRHASRNHAIVADLRRTSGADDPGDMEAAVARKAAAIANLMALLHGGEWRVRIDHQEGLVMIGRRRRRGIV